MADWVHSSSDNWTRASGNCGGLAWARGLSGLRMRLLRARELGLLEKALRPPQVSAEAWWSELTSLGEQELQRELKQKVRKTCGSFLDEAEGGLAPVEEC